MSDAANPAEWRGRDLIDRDGETIGTLEDVYVDTEMHMPTFGSVSDGHFSKRLTFVPLADAMASPDGLHVVVSRREIKDAPSIEKDGELDDAAENRLYGYYEIVDETSAVAGGRRLAKQ